MPECFVEVINKCLYLFRGAECRDNEADGKKWRGLAVPVLHVDNQVQNASLGTHNMSQAKAIIVHFALSFAPQRMPGISIKVNSTRVAEIKCRFHS